MSDDMTIPRETSPKWTIGRQHDGPAREWIEDYNSCSSGDDSVPGAALHVATAALLAVLDLHKPETEYFDPQYDEFLTQCDGCYEDWPCDTVRAIDKALGANDD